MHGGTITTSGADQAAMILCLDGSDENIGTFTYNEHGITVTKGTAVGNGSTTGWSKDASGRWWYYDAQHGKPIFDSHYFMGLCACFFL